MRADFVLQHHGEAKTIVEVKTVVDTDCAAANHPEELGEAGEEGSAEGTNSKKTKKKKKKQSVFLSHSVPYCRSAIFPWGGGNQTGPDGEKVVSARAIKHVRELTAVARGERTEDGATLSAAVLFLVVRGDAFMFRPNHEACPSFARYLREAADAGVQVLAHRVRWGSGSELGKAFWMGPIPVSLAASSPPG